MEFFRRTKGVISVFLIIIMLPLFTSAVLLVDGARYQSAKTIIQEAGDLAAYSTIANYNMDLKDEYGLFAIDDDDISGSFEKYFKETLGVSDSEAKTYAQEVQSMISSLTGGNKYADASFFNLFDFEVTSVNAEGIHDLADPGVLQNQIVEYVKYRGVETILERFEVIKKFSQGKADATGSAQTMNAITELSEIDQNESKGVAEAIRSTQEAIRIYNKALTEVVTDAKDYEYWYEKEICAMAVNDLENAAYYKKLRQSYAEKILNKVTACEGGLKDKYSVIGNWCEIVKVKVNDAIASYEALKAKYSGQKEIIEDIDSELGILKTIISTDKAHGNYSVVVYYQSLYDPYDFCTDAQEALEVAENRVNNAHSIYNQYYRAQKAALEENEEMSDEEKETYLYENVVYNIYDKDHYEFAGTKDKIYLYESIDDTLMGWAKTFVDGFGVHSLMNNRYKYLYLNMLMNYYDKYAEDNKTVKNDETGEKIKAEEDENKAEDAKNTANNSGKREESESEKRSNKTINDDIYSALPSQVAKKGGGSEKKIAKVTGDDASEMIKSSKNAGSEFAAFFESGRNDILTFCYILDMFKTRNSTTDYSNKTNGKWYSTTWRFLNKNGEVDLRDRKKDSSLKTFFDNGEVEYVFGGNKSEGVNEAIVYSWIYGTRLANNMVAVYTNPTAKAECLALAAMSSALTGGFVPVSVFKWIYIAAWAAGETALELTYLIDDGYRVPLIKTKRNLFIDSFGSIASAVSEGTRENLLKANSGSALDVCYEDYLLMLMCFVGRETRLLRVADLIEMNMNERGNKDFKMSEAYTYVHADTTVKMNHLFQKVKQFENSYSTSSLSLSNEIYQGY